MTKTHEEIKKGLECCAASSYKCADDCPYRAECRNGQGGKVMNEDALALIQHLEKDKDDLLEERELNDFLRDRVKQLEAERDAAVADLKSYRCCHGCKHLGVGFNEPCLHCDFENNCFEWRGVQKEDGNAKSP